MTRQAEALPHLELSGYEIWSAKSVSAPTACLDRLLVGPVTDAVELVCADGVPAEIGRPIVVLIQDHLL